MAMTAKKKAALKAQKQAEPIFEQKEKVCTCLVAIRGRGQHAIDCALFG